jgi:hypothetical protein
MTVEFFRNSSHKAYERMICLEFRSEVWQKKLSLPVRILLTRIHCSPHHQTVRKFRPFWGPFGTYFGTIYHY